MDTSVLASNVSPAVQFLKRNSLALALIAGFSNPAQALDWEIKNLGILPDAEFSTGAALNDLGQVTGNMNYGVIDEGGIPRGIQYVYVTGPNGSGPLQLIDTSTVEQGISVYSG